jgi:hypothetical protein
MNVGWGHSNLELQVFTMVFMMQLLLLAYVYLTSSGREKQRLKGKMVSTPGGVYSASGGKSMHNVLA